MGIANWWDYRGDSAVTSAIMMQERIAMAKEVSVYDVMAIQTSIKRENGEPVWRVGTVIAKNKYHFTVRDRCNGCCESWSYVDVALAPEKFKCISEFEVKNYMKGRKDNVFRCGIA